MARKSHATVFPLPRARPNMIGFRSMGAGRLARADSIAWCRPTAAEPDGRHAFRAAAG
jgi:hypothetical protein